MSINRIVDAIIVTLNPSKMLLYIVKKLCADETVNNVFIWDNSSSDKTQLDKIRKEYDSNVIIIDNDVNVGLGKAFNSIIKQWSSAKFIITFDQDSYIKKNFVKELLLSLDIARSKDKKLVAIGPKVRNYSEEICKEDDTYTNIHQIKYRPFLITSGNLIYRHIFDQVGYYDEDFFIDCVDYDISFKIRKKYRLCQERSVTIYQNVGEGKWKNVSARHNDKRMYYAIRNHIRMTKRWILKMPLWIIYLNFAFWKEFKGWYKESDKSVVVATLKEAIADS